MTFNSLTYMLFLALALLCYWTAPARHRQLLICLTSIAFYMLWKPLFVLVMLGSATVDYLVAQKLEATTDLRHRKWLLAITLLINFGLLAYFKYLFFLLDNMSAALSLLGHPIEIPHLNIILPLGISFYTFETVSYSIDVYRRVVPAERNLFSYFSFVTFFPKLIAGPILRAGQLLPQLKSPQTPSSATIALGVQEIVTGLLIKGLFADAISPLVDDGFARPAANWSALDAWTMALLFGFQIYFDFSAYSRMAIGSSRLFGIDLPRNFNFPYHATSPKDFWKRWHISLSSWVRDYLYIPLTGEKFHTGGRSDESRHSEGAREPLYLGALFITWATMGLWHGASWAFVLWGVMHACYIAGYRLTAPLREALPMGLRTVGGQIITLALAMLAWIPFRSASLQDALTILGKVITPSAYTSLGLRENTYLVAVIMLLLTLVAKPLSDWLARATASSQRFDALAYFLAGLCMVPLALVFLRPINQFIYFQF